MRSNKQEAISIEKQLDSIWRMGDKCECSMKHIFWGLAALMRNLNWKDGIDYPTPWGEDKDNIVRLHFPYKLKRWEKMWNKVTAKRDNWGTEKFTEVVKLSKFEFAVEYIKQFDW